MTRCTVCGATSREGARFCTSCGTRLADDDNGAQPDISTATPAPTESTAAVNEPPAPESDTADSREGASPEPDRYISSWPSSTSDAEANASPTEQDESPAPSVTPAMESSPEETPSSDNGDASWPTPAPSNSIDDDAVSESPVADDARDSSASTEWAAPASSTSGKPDSTASAHSVQFERLHELLDEMQQRIERISDPATLASRNLNPDELADQLGRWSRAVPDTDSLLAAVRQARRAPRDIDALRQLSDRAADLELLVQHYQSITATSAQWAADLRRIRDKPTDS